MDIYPGIGIHGKISMDYHPCTTTHGYLSIEIYTDTNPLIIVHGYLVWHQCVLYGGFLVDSWWIQGGLIGNLWVIHGGRVVEFWGTYGGLMVDLWGIDGGFMGWFWVTYGRSNVDLWIYDLKHDCFIFFSFSWFLIELRFDVFLVRFPVPKETRLKPLNQRIQIYSK